MELGVEMLYELEHQLKSQVDPEKITLHLYQQDLLNARRE
jgi:hypothetical protein